MAAGTDPSSFVDGEFRFLDLPQNLTLQAGQTYALTMSTTAGDSDLFHHFQPHTGTSPLALNLVDDFVAAAANTDGNYPSDLTGNDYAVTFDTQHYYLASDGLWKTTNYADSIGRVMNTEFSSGYDGAELYDLTGSSVGGVGVYGNTAGTIDLFLTVNVVSPDYNYADGVKFTFPAGIVIKIPNSAKIIN